MGQDRVIIFDTTLRDGEQAPGAALTVKQKLEIAHQLARLNVDVIEGGFPFASPGDFEAVSLIAKEVKGPIICGLARTLKGDIDRCYEAVRKAARPRIHVFIATSQIHMQYKLKKAKEEILRQAVEMVRYAKSKMDNVEFSPEDASRSERNFLCQVLEAVISAGATTVNIPDTVGYATPFDFGDLIWHIREHVPNIDQAVISIHCHNDLGLSSANSLAAIKHGAGQVECTINGIGERAGNASLEEIVMALDVRKELFSKRTGINKKELYKTSRLVSKLTGLVVQPNKAIVGANAFAHESGIHQDGVLKMRRTYEIISPEEVGYGESRFVLGKLSGRHAFSERLRKLGCSLSEEELNKAFDRFKRLADKKKDIFDEDLIAIVEDEIANIPERWRLDFFHTTGGSDTTPTATVKLRSNGKVVRGEATGDGPVDACCKAIDKITKESVKLLDYQIKSTTSGKDALGEVTVKIQGKDGVVTGRGASTDVIEASARAYLNALNKLLYWRTRKARLSPETP